jgi:hypothetical protein
MELLIASAIEAAAGILAGYAAGGLLRQQSVSLSLRLLAGIAGGIASGALATWRIGDPMAGNGMLNLIILAMVGFAGGGMLSGIVGAILKAPK